MVGSGVRGVFYISRHLYFVDGQAASIFYRECISSFGAAQVAGGRIAGRISCPGLVPWARETRPLNFICTERHCRLKERNDYLIIRSPSRGGGGGRGRPCKSLVRGLYGTVKILVIKLPLAENDIQQSHPSNTPVCNAVIIQVQYTCDVLF